MQNLDFANEEYNTIDFGLSSTSDIEVEFDYDEALRNLEVHNIEEEKTEEPVKPTKSPPICIYQRLRSLYREEKYRKRILPRTTNTSYLLDKLLQRESFNMVVLTLYPCSKGYSIGFCTVDGQVFQETRHPYSQDMLLDYIDKEELPTPFLDSWEQTFPQMFYSGSVIVKVKDLRYTQEPQVRHVLLKPHTQSIINDVNMIALDHDHGSWMSMEDKISVESAVVNTVKNPLCLDPSVRTGILRFHSHYAKGVINTNFVRSAVHRNSQLNLSRKRRADDLAIKPVFESNRTFTNFIAKKKRLQELTRCESLSTSFKDLEEVIASRSSDNSDYKNVKDLARPIVLNKESAFDYTPKLIKKCIFVPDQPHKHDQRLRVGASNASNYHIELEISERPANSEYVGTLYVGSEHNETDNNGSKCSFTLGSKATASRYIEHFTDIFTKEKDGKGVRITHIVPGQPPRETCISAAHEPSPRNQSNIRVQNNGKTFLQIGPNTSVGSIQQCSFKGGAKISVQQFQPQSVSGKTITADCTSDGTQFSSVPNSTILSRMAKTTLVNNLSSAVNRSAISKQKIVSRKMTISNSGLSGLADIKIPLIAAPSTNQRVQDQVMTRADVVSAISQNLQSVNSASLKDYKSGMMRTVHTGTLEAPQTLHATLGLPAVHLITGPKDKSVTSNGQSATSSLSLSLPSLSALLADSPLTNSQSLKKSNNSLEPSQ